MSQIKESELCPTSMVLDLFCSVPSDELLSKTTDHFRIWLNKSISFANTNK